MQQANVKLKFTKKSIYVFSSLNKNFDDSNFGDELEKIIDSHVEKGSLSPAVGFIRSDDCQREHLYVSCMLKEKHKVCGLTYPVRLIHCLETDELEKHGKNLLKKFIDNKSLTAKEKIELITQELLQHVSNFVDGIPLPSLELENA